MNNNINESAENFDGMFLRPDDLLESMGISFKGLSDEERVMQGLLIEEYKKRGKNLLEEIKNLRVNSPTMSLGEAIKSLYESIGGTK